MNHFSFDRSAAIIEAWGSGPYSQKGWGMLMIRTATHKEDFAMEVADLKFIVSRRLEKSTNHPCFDPLSGTIGFSDEMHRQHYLKHWNISVN